MNRFLASTSSSVARLPGQTEPRSLGDFLEDGLASRCPFAAGQDTQVVIPVILIFFFTSSCQDLQQNVELKEAQPRALGKNQKQNGGNIKSATVSVSWLTASPQNQT